MTVHNHTKHPQRLKVRFIFQLLSLLPSFLITRGIQREKRRTPFLHEEQEKTDLYACSSTVGIDAACYRFIAGLRYTGIDTHLCVYHQNRLQWCKSGAVMGNCVVDAITPRGVWLRPIQGSTPVSQKSRLLFVGYGDAWDPADEHGPTGAWEQTDDPDPEKTFWLTAQGLPLAELRRTCPELCKLNFDLSCATDPLSMPLLTVEISGKGDAAALGKVLADPVEESLARVGWDTRLGDMGGLKRFRFQHLSLEQESKRIESILNHLLPQGVSYTLDHNTNSLILMQFSGSFEPIYRAMRGIDQPKPLLHFRLSWIATSHSCLKQLNHDLTQSDFWKGCCSTVENCLTHEQPTLLSLSNLSNFAKHLLDLEFAALESEQKIRVLSRPTIVTLSGSPATFKQGRELPYQASSKGGQTTTKFKEALLQLQLTAHQLPNQKIVLSIQMLQGTPTARPDSQGNPLFSIDKQELSTCVEMMPGEILLLAGLEEQCEKVGQENRPGWLTMGWLTAWLKQKHHSNEQKVLLLLLEARPTAKRAPSA